MKRIFLATLVALVLIATGCTKGNLTEVPFLKAMNLDVTKVEVNGKLQLSSDTAKFAHVALTDEQFSKLAPADPNSEFKGKASNPCIVAAKQLEGGNVMLAIYFNVSDDYAVRILTYDKDGKVLDNVDTDAWDQHIDMGEGNVLSDSTYAEFAQNTMTLHRTIGRTLNDSTIWSQNRDYCYTFNADGTMTLTEIKTAAVSGKLEESDGTIEEFDIDDFNNYSDADTTVFAAVEKALQKYPTNVLGEDDDWTTDVVADLFRLRGNQFLTFVSRHHDSALVPIFKATVSEEYFDKQDLDSAINTLADEAIKKDMMTFTAQWVTNPSD